MSSLGYSEFNDVSLTGTGGTTANQPSRRGAAAANGSGDDGYIATKRKNKTMKSFESATTMGSGDSAQPPFNPKLERLKQSIAKIHMSAGGSDEEDADGDDGGGGTAHSSRTNMLPSYPGQGLGQGTIASSSAPPIADAGSGLNAESMTGFSSQPLPPTTAEGRTHQPMFSLSQQSASRLAKGGSGGIERFGMKMPSTYAAQYYKQFVPYNRMSNELSSAGTNSDELIEKLNYIVHMLEEQHNERTEHVAEELVLYCFLGVFIIFIVDSFARAGKYTR